jgi:hypothetical protein
MRFPCRPAATFLAGNLPWRTACGALGIGHWALGTVRAPGTGEAGSGTAALSPAAQTSGTGSLSVPTLVCDERRDADRTMR